MNIRLLVKKMVFCENCGTELADDATFCSNCGNKVKHVHKKQEKNIYIALILTFILTGLGSIYAGNPKKGLMLLIARLATAIIGVFIGIFFIFSVLVWTYGFYEAYRDVRIANGYSNPKFLDDFNGWDQNNKIIAILIIFIILLFTFSGCYSVLSVDSHSYSNTDAQYPVYHGGSGSSSSGSSQSSHYGGVDDSPHTIAKNDPDWYYDHYDYGDYDDIDEDLESQGYE